MSKKEICIYILKKILLFLASIFLLSVIVFYISRLAPGDPLVSYYGERVEKMSPEEHDWAMEKLGLNESVSVQYVKWLSNAFHGEFGISYKYKMDVLEKPTEVRSDMRIRLEPRITSGNDVLTVEHLSKAFPGQTLFQDLNFEIKRGERVAIIGNNGTGKTTILKILNEVIRPDAGSFTLGSRVQIGYYDQEHQVLHMEKTIFQEISDAYPYLTNTEIRNVLAAFLFTNDDVFQPIHTLSGGERGRISLAKLMLSNANFLILDEPTNHLDIVSKEILENALKDYTGTVLYVSHDRYFINQTATRILELTGQTLVNYIGNYDYYLEKKEELTRIYAPAADAAAPEETAAPSEASSTKLDWKAQKEEQARLRKKENELKKTEKRIEELETRDSEIDEEMSKPEVATNVAECVKLSKEKAEIAAELEELYEKWEELAE